MNFSLTLPAFQRLIQTEPIRCKIHFILKFLDSHLKQLLLVKYKTHKTHNYKKIQQQVSSKHTPREALTRYVPLYLTPTLAFARTSRLPIAPEPSTSVPLARLVFRAKQTHCRAEIPGGCAHRRGGKGPAPSRGAGMHNFRRAAAGTNVPGDAGPARS